MKKRYRYADKKQLIVTDGKMAMINTLIMAKVVQEIE